MTTKLWHGLEINLYNPKNENYILYEGEKISPDYLKNYLVSLKERLKKKANKIIILSKKEEEFSERVRQDICYKFGGETSDKIRKLAEDINFINNIHKEISDFKKIGKDYYKTSKKYEELPENLKKKKKLKLEKIAADLCFRESLLFGR
jgi:hypothetical protein